MKRSLWIATVLWFSCVSVSVAEDIVIHCYNLSGEASPAGTFLMDCTAKASSLSFPIGFTVQLNYTDNAAQKITMIQDKAIETFLQWSVVVGGNDKKTLFGAPNN